MLLERLVEIHKNSIKRDIYLVHTMYNFLMSFTMVLIYPLKRSNYYYYNHQNCI